MSRKLLFVVIPTLVSFSSLLASPNIEFNSKVVNCGTFYEGSIEKLHATFIVKNTGDSVLKINNVKPGCGCTDIRYDSIIGPGKSGKFESNVNIKNYQSGKIAKYITVSSNAQNEPTVRLEITATLISEINISDRFINLNKGNNTTPKTITLSSKKSDLKISAVVFKSEPNGNKETADKFDPQIPITFKFVKDSKLSSDSLHSYKLDLYAIETKDIISGQFLISTNDPKKSQILIPGMITQ
jgi:hypothetical protein